MIFFFFSYSVPPLCLSLYIALLVMNIFFLNEKKLLVLFNLKAFIKAELSTGFVRRLNKRKSPTRLQTLLLFSSNFDILER